MHNVMILITILIKIKIIITITYSQKNLLINQLKNDGNFFIFLFIMRFAEIKVAKEKLHGAKKYIIIIVMIIKTIIIIIPIIITMLVLSSNSK